MKYTILSVSLFFSIFANMALASSGENFVYTETAVSKVVGIYPYPKGVDTGCAKKAVEAMGSEVVCENSKQTLKTIPNFPLRAEAKETKIKLSFTEENGFSDVKYLRDKVSISIGWTWTFLVLIVPTIIILIMSARNKERRALIAFNVGIASYIALIGLAANITHTTEAYPLMVLMAWLLVIFACSAAEGILGGLAATFVGLQGLLTVRVGWQNAAMTEYAVFLLGICILGWVLREILAWHKRRKKPAQKNFSVPGQ